MPEQLRLGDVLRQTAYSRNFGTELHQLRHP